mmetsp:Transcript_44905/g.72271  ORF Transcript_44905/g.72271 Transcript_44905/m.72271 type:complete len:211 (+) Transcript_44905:667-1299(+)
MGVGVECGWGWDGGALMSDNTETKMRCERRLSHPQLHAWQWERDPTPCHTHPQIFPLRHSCLSQTCIWEEGGSITFARPGMRCGEKVWQHSRIPRSKQILSFATRHVTSCAPSKSRSWRQNWRVIPCARGCRCEVRVAMGSREGGVEGPIKLELEQSVWGLLFRNHGLRVRLEEAHSQSLLWSRPQWKSLRRSRRHPLCEVEHNRQKKHL